MIDVNVRSDLKDLSKGLRLLGRRVPTATARTINKTATTANSEFARRMNRETKLKVGFIKKRISRTKANRARLVATLTALRADTNIIEWVTAAKRNPRAWRKKKGVASRAWGRSRTYKGSFIGSGKSSGKQLVFVRDPRTRSGVKALHGPNIQAYMRNKKTAQHMEMVIRRRFEVVFIQEINYELQKLRGLA